MVFLVEQVPANQWVLGTSLRGNIRLLMSRPSCRLYAAHVGRSWTSEHRRLHPPFWVPKRTLHWSPWGWQGSLTLI